MMGVRPGFFQAEDAQNNDASAYMGGVIYRTAFTAAALSSTVNANRANCPDQYGDVDYGFTSISQAANRPWQFQYVQQDAYKGLLPWEIMPQIPQQQPWE